MEAVAVVVKCLCLPSGRREIVHACGAKERTENDGAKGAKQDGPLFHVE